MISGTALLEALPVAVYVTDSEGHITFYNQAAADLWGCRPELGESKWCGSWRLFWPDGRPMRHDECPMAVALKEGRTVRGAEAVAERPDGTRIPFEPYPTPLRDETGRLIGAINLLVDLSHAKRNELESERLAAIVRSSDDAIISKTLEGRITSWNQGATRIFGYEASEMVGQPITRIIPPELHSEETEILTKLSRGEHIDHYETVRVAKDGRRIDISLTISPLRNKAGRVVGAAKVARDISERKQAEQLQQLLIEELNHRVRNTLATVQAVASQSLRRAKSPAEFVTSFTGRIHALAKAHTLLSQTRLQGAHVIDLVREQVLLGNGDQRVSYSGPLIMLDSQSTVQLALVLHELATNARKYGALSVPNGRLSIRWEVRSNDGKELFLDWKESNSPAVHAPASQGFGMMLIKQTMQSRGGEARLSYAADGMACAIRLPLPREEDVKIAPAGSLPTSSNHSGSAKQSEAPRPLEGRRILIVEDEPLVAMDMEANLSDFGCQVVGPAGKYDAAKRLIAEASYDAVLLDVNLAGHAVDDLAAALKQKDVPFAFVTGHGREGLPEGFREGTLLSKPFNPDQLLATVQEVLGPRQQASAGILQFHRRS